MIAIAGSAAALVALSVALDAADKDADVRSLIEQGRAWVRAVQVPAGPATVHYRLAAAAFMRSWARHEPARAADLIRGAEDLELAAEVHIATMPRLD